MLYMLIGENCRVYSGMQTDCSPEPTPAIRRPRRKIYILSTICKNWPENRQTSASRIPKFMRSMKLEIIAPINAPK